MAALSQQAVDIHGVCNRRILLQVLLSVLPYVRFQLLRLALPLLSAEKVGVSAHRIEKFGMLGSEQTLVHLDRTLETRLRLESPAIAAVNDAEMSKNECPHGALFFAEFVNASERTLDQGFRASRVPLIQM